MNLNTDFKPVTDSPKEPGTRPIYTDGCLYWYLDSRSDDYPNEIIQDIVNGIVNEYNLLDLDKMYRKLVYPNANYIELPIHVGYSSYTIMCAKFDDDGLQEKLEKDRELLKVADVEIYKLINRIVTKLEKQTGFGFIHDNVFTDDNLVSSVRLHKFYKEQGIRKLYVTLITGLVTEDGIVEKNLSNTVAILTSMVIDEIALYEKPNSPLFISLEELTKKIIHFANEFKDESNPLFEKVDVFNKLLKSGKVNFGAVYNCVSDYLTFNSSTVKRLGNDGKCYLLSNTYRDNASVYFVKDELILGKIYTDKDVVKLDDNKQYVVIPESLIANTLLNTNGGNSNVVSGYNYSALNAVFDKEALLDHYHDIVSEITKHDLILNRGVSLELEKIHLSDVSSDVRTNGGWGKLYKEVSGKELNESGFGTVKICDGLYGIKDGLFNIYSQSNKEYGINEF